jgi:glycosyltransferase involved in cell wall biosynthesis
VGASTRSDRGIKAWLLSRLGLAQEVESSLLDQIAAAGLSDSFHLLGYTRDVQSVFHRTDVLCFPSHLDAPGRSVFEAAFSSIPSIVAVNTPRPDTLVPGETGLAVPGKSPDKLAEAIIYFADHPEEIRRMGANARKLAERNFTPVTNAEQLLAVYRRILCLGDAHSREALAG